MTSPDGLGSAEEFDAVASQLGEWDDGEDMDDIPPRRWLLGMTFCQGYVSSLIATGGVGKTALRIAQALSVATGRPLTDEHVFRRARVLYVSLEDDRNELRRRVRAAKRHHGIKSQDTRGWLYLAAPKGIRLAELKDGNPKASELDAILREIIETRRIDLVILDPFVKAHGLEENANTSIDFVVGLLAKIAIDLDCAMDSPHHVSKGPAQAGDADKARGASAFVAAARAVHTLTPMTPEEAPLFNIGEAERRAFVRLDSAKINIAPRSAKAIWFRLVGVKLDNGTPDYPCGDEVQTVERWNPPDLWDGTDHGVLNAILDTIEAGLPDGSRFSSGSAAKGRAAWRAVIQHAPDKTEAQAREIIKTWLKTGLLTMEQYDDPVRREKAQGLRVNHARRPS